MKELTRIITAQITLIETMPDEDAETIIKAKEVAEKHFTDDIKWIYSADDVTVKIQDFVVESEK